MKKYIRKEEEKQLTHSKADNNHVERVKQINKTIHPGSVAC